MEKIILMICGMILISGNFAMAGTKGNNKEKKVDTEKVQKAKDLENKPLGVLINQVRNIKDRSKRNIYYKVIRKKLPKTKEEKQLIRKFLKDDNADNKIFAMEILARIKEKTVVPTLIKNLKHKDNRVRVTAAVALGKIGDKRGVRPLLENIDLMNLEFGYCPVAEIGALALPELIKAAKKTSLLGLLPKKERKDKRSRRAADCIGDIRDEKAIPELMKLLKDDDADVRLAAVRALAGMKVKEANSEFKKMLNDSDERVRMSTLRTLAKADKTKYLPKVFETVQEKKGYEKGHAIKLIGDLGAKEFIPKLKELLKDTNEYTRHDAAYSLWKITGKAYPYKRGRDTLHSEQFWKKRLKDARGPGRDHESPRNAIQEAQKNGFLLDEKVE